MQKRCVALGLLVLILLAVPAWGQEVTASIVGNVKDPTGAVIVGATVTITNTDKNIVARTVKTDASGSFSAPLLPIGTYSVTAEAGGFKKATESAIVLNFNSKRLVTLTLAVGDAKDIVTVEASALQVETQNTAAGGLISGNQLRELSLPNRNYATLLTLVPGVTSTAADQMYVGGFAPGGTANTVQFSINGGRTSQNNWTVDGADNVDRGAALTLLTFPSVDSIAEFKLLKGSYDAEFGRNGAGQVNVVTRSGTSAFHGGAYEFWRNDILNANRWFNKHYADPAQYIPRAPLRYHNFGWTLGGPVYIPGVYNTKKDKTFFFFSQEFRRYIQYGNPSIKVPTADERNGIFRSPVCIQWSGNVGTSNTCTQYGTTIPQASFSPLAQQYLTGIWSKVPVPNPAASDDYHQVHSTWTNVFNYREELLRLDHVFSSRLAVSAKMLRDDIPTTEPGGIYGTASVPGMATTHSNSPGHQYTSHVTGTVSPTFLIDGGYAYSYGAIESDPVGYTLIANSPGIHATLPFTPIHPRIPNISFGILGQGVAGVGPYKDYNFNHNLFANVTKILGTHTLKWGGNFNHYRKTENNTGGTEGTFSFNNSGKPTGAAGCDPLNPTVCTTDYMQAWANFLLGHASSFSQSAVDITPDIRQNSFELFGQDSWRITPRLTLNLGLRWSIFRQPYDDKDQISNFDPRAYDPNKAPCMLDNGNLDVTLVNGKPTSACNPNYDPLNGFYIAGRNSPWGRKLTNEDMHDFAPRIGIAWDPLGDGKTSVRGGYGMFYDTILVGSLEFDILFNPYMVNSVNIPNTSLDNPAAGVPSGASAAKRVYGRAPDPWQTPYTEQYSLDIQRELGRGFLLDVGYYGSQGHHLIGVIDLNQPTPNAYLTQLPACSATVTTNCWGTVTGGVVTKAAITSAQTPILNRIRPYKGYLGVDAMETMFNSNYNSLQVQLQKKFRGNAMLNVAYTWSKALTDNQTDRSTAPQNSSNIRGDYGPMQQDRTHVFTANFVYPLPFFREQHGVIGHIVGGWEFSGVISAWSGVPYTVSTSSIYDPAGLGCKATSPCAIRPDIVGDPSGPQTFDKWFNTAAFQDTVITGTVPTGGYVPGTSRRGDIRGPGLQNWNLALFKSIKITERVTTQFRAESFNAFNHTNWDGADTNVSNTTTFGKITGTRDPRIVQLGLKLNF